MKIPEGVSFEVRGNAMSAKGPGGEISKEFNQRLVKVEVKDGEVSVTPLKKERSSIRAAVGAVKSHVTNMLAGAKGEYSKKLQVVFAHFPVSMEVKGSEVVIKNFLGEKSARKAKIIKGAKVDVKGQEINVHGPDKEAVGQTCSNLIGATRITNRDERVFQDGIYYA
ncbi:50S ribosomal protein L6 [Candidatus Norongarragalina meridionalis]|nr:50S ribosomal protein L6 [Candidatus Norongarragalina meridionalis]